MVVYPNYISGKWVNSNSKRNFTSLNPADETIVGEFQQSTKDDVEQAVISAQKAFELWRNIPAPKRAQLLFRMRDLLLRDKEKLAKLIVKEMGKVLIEARGDVQEAIDVFEYMAGEGRRIFGHTTPSEMHNKFAMTIRSPIGVVGLITPWNFPIAIPAWKTSAALICGNTIVWKPSSDTPLCAIELMKLFIEAGFPRGVINLVTGSGKEVGNAIVVHYKIHALSFTGSKSVGEEIIKKAGVKKVGLELGGKNAVIIMDDADIDLAVKGVVWGAFGTAGQRCTSTSRIIIHTNVKSEFEKKLIIKVKNIKIGNGLTSDVGPLINARAVEKVEKYVEIGKKEGARLLCGGNSKKIKGKGYFFEPTIFSNCTSKMQICQEEIFGPVLSIISVKSYEEAILVANDSSYGLSSAIFTSDMQKAFRAIEELNTGIVYVNAPTIGAEVHLPFGGVKGTGNGAREAGIHGIEEFSEVKTVYINYSGKNQRATIDDVDKK